VALNIKNEKTHQLVRSLSKSLGRSQASVIDTAVAQFALSIEKELKGGDIRSRIERTDALFEEIRRLVPPDHNVRSDADCFLYDEQGMYA
jgi:antitoxin VapB